VRNHALVDGNKRLGWLATWVFCDLNGVTLSPSQDEAVDLIVDIAEGKLPNVDEIVARLHQFTSLASEGFLPDARLSPDDSPELSRDPD
jgi:death-on-curing protein